MKDAPGKTIRCGRCLGEFDANHGHSCPREAATDAHHSAAVLIAEITDLRAQLAGEKAKNAKLLGLLGQAEQAATGLKCPNCGSRAGRILNEWRCVRCNAAGNISIY